MITDGYRLRTSGRLVSTIEKIFSVAKNKIGFLQLREQKENPASEDDLISIVSDLLPLCWENNVNLIINSNYQLVKKTNCSGVHLDSSQTNFSEVRDYLGKDFIIGASAHSLEDVLRAENANCDYAFLSPIFKPLSKEIVSPTLGLEFLEKTAKSTRIPIYALGGIDLNNCQEVLTTSVAGVAMISSILLASAPEKEIEKFVKLL